MRFQADTVAGTEGNGALREPTSPATEVWHSDDLPAIRCFPQLLEDLADLAMQGFRRYPWGGVELGGLLLGRHESTETVVLEFRPFDCEHENGPSFDLSPKDIQEFAALIEHGTSEGLVPVGWFHTISGRELEFSARARAAHKELFAESRQIAMVLRRSKVEPVQIAFFEGNSNAGFRLHSPVREWTGIATPVEEPPVVPPPPAPSIPPASQVSSAPVEPVAHSAPVEMAPAEPLKWPGPIAKVISIEYAVAPIEVPRQAEVLVARKPHIPPPPPIEELPNPIAGLGLHEDPFAPGLDLRFFCPLDQYRKATTTLLHRIRSGAGVVALIGETGTGKSLLLEHLKEQFNAASIEFAHASSHSLTVPEFYRLLAHDFRLDVGESTRTATLIALNQHLTDRAEDGRSTVLLVDNAHELSTEVLDEIYGSGNLESRNGRLLQVILSAQPSLENRLKTPELAGLRQRILFRTRLQGLTAQQTQTYINHRLSIAGRDAQNIFPEDLMPEIHERAHGIPRFINFLCSSLLELCWERNCTTVDRRMLDEVSEELDFDPQPAAE